MASGPLNVKFVATDGLVWQGDALSVLVRTVEGDIGILAGHEPLMAVPPGARRVFLPMAMARRTLERTLLPDFDPYKPQPDSRLRILWTLWRASRSHDFRG